MTLEEPHWQNEDSKETYWRAVYQIETAEQVVVENYCRSESKALELAEAALAQALKKVSELGIKVNASCWTVKHCHRKQVQTWDKLNVREYVTTKWNGRVQQVAKGLAQKGQS